MFKRPKRRQREADIFIQPQKLSYMPAQGQRRSRPHSLVPEIPASIYNRASNKTSLFLRRRFVLYITAQEWDPLFHEVHNNSLEQRNVLVQCMLTDSATLPIVTLHNNESTALTTQKITHSVIILLFHRITGYCIE